MPLLRLSNSLACSRASRQTHRTGGRTTTPQEPCDRSVHPVRQMLSPRRLNSARAQATSTRIGRTLSPGTSSRRPSTWNGRMHCSLDFSSHLGSASRRQTPSVLPQVQLTLGATRTGSHATRSPRASPSAAAISATIRQCWGRQAPSPELSLRWRVISHSTCAATPAMIRAACLRRRSA